MQEIHKKCYQSHSQQEQEQEFPSASSSSPTASFTGLGRRDLEVASQLLTNIARLNDFVKGKDDFKVQLNRINAELALCNNSQDGESSFSSPRGDALESHSTESVWERRKPLQLRPLIDSGSSSSLSSPSATAIKSLRSSAPPAPRNQQEQDDLSPNLLSSQRQHYLRHGRSYSYNHHSLNNNATTPIHPHHQRSFSASKRYSYNSALSSSSSSSAPSNRFSWASSPSDRDSVITLVPQTLHPKHSKKIRKLSSPSLSTPTSNKKLSGPDISLSSPAATVTSDISLSTLDSSCTTRFDSPDCYEKIGDEENYKFSTVYCPCFQSDQASNKSLPPMSATLMPLPLTEHTPTRPKFDNEATTPTRSPHPILNLCFLWIKFITILSVALVVIIYEGPSSLFGTNKTSNEYLQNDDNKNNNYNTNNHNHHCRHLSYHRHIGTNKKAAN